MTEHDTKQDRPPTLVDLAALDEASASACRCVLPDEGLIPCRACRDLLPLLRGAAPRLLAALRALAGEWEERAPSTNEYHEGVRHGFMRAARDIRALLGEAAR